MFYPGFSAADLSGVAVADYAASNPCIRNGVWHHVAYVRNGTNFYIFVDGVSQPLTVTTAIGSTAMPDYPNPLRVGCWSYNVYDPLNAGLDEFRISKGIARWTSDFVPPTGPYVGSLYQLQPNGDSALNYGDQSIAGVGAVASALNDVNRNGILVGQVPTSGNVSMAKTTMYAKSGNQRFAITRLQKNTTGTTIGANELHGQTWSNSTDEITNIVVAADVPNGIGVGSRIDLFAKKVKT
jgi:hypothetical protein